MNLFEALAVACRRELEKVIKAFDELFRVQMEAIEKLFDELFTDDSDSLEHNTQKLRRDYAFSRNIRFLGEHIISYGGPEPREVGSCMGGRKGKRISSASMLSKLERGRNISGHLGLSVDWRCFLTSFSSLRGSRHGAPKEQVA